MAEPIKKQPDPKLVVFLNQRYKLINIFIVVIILLLGYFLLLNNKIAGLNDQANSSLPQKTAELKLLDDYSKAITSLETLVNGYQNQYSSQIKSLEQVLPDAAKVPELIAQLSAITLQAGFKITSVDIVEAAEPTKKKKAAVEGEVAAPVESATPQGTALGAIKTLNITLKVVGGDYLAFKNLLDKIQKNIRILDLVSISFSASSGNELNTNEYDLSLKTYYLKP